MSFAHAPVSKALLLVLSLTSVLASSFNFKYLFNVPLSYVTRDLQLWRLVSHHFAFANSSELFATVLLLFNISVTVERLFGSRKMASFVVLSAAMTSALELAALALLSSLGLSSKSLPAGPFGVLMAISYQYYRIVPSTYNFRIVGVSFSNKVLQYFFLVQLIGSNPAQSFLPSACGLVTGYLIRADLFGARKWRIPLILSSFSSRFLRPLIGSTKTQRRSTRTVIGEDDQASTFSASGLSSAMSAAAGRTQATRRAGAASTTPAAAPGNALREWRETLAGQAAVPLNADQVASVSAMFPALARDRIENALRLNNNDTSRAVESLLGQG